MYTYDFIVGIKLSQYHNKTLKYERVELDTTSPTEIYKRLGEMVSDCMNMVIEIPNRDEINRVLSLVSSTLNAPNVGAEELTAVDNCFDTIAYLGIEADAFRRDDGVVPATDQKEVMAFIVNTKVEDVDERIAPALSIFTDESSKGSIPNLVMETFRSRIRINAVLEDVIKLNTIIDKWELLTKVGSADEMDVTRLHTLLNDIGFKLKVFVS